MSTVVTLYMNTCSFILSLIIIIITTFKCSKLTNQLVANGRVAKCRSNEMSVSPGIYQYTVYSNNLSASRRILI